MIGEAVRFQLPAISSDNGDLGELVRKYKIGFVFNAEDVDSLNHTLLAFLDSSHSQREAMSNNCERFYDDFSYNKWSQKCMKIFSDSYGQTGKKELTKRVIV